MDLNETSPSFDRDYTIIYMRQRPAYATYRTMITTQNLKSYIDRHIGPSNVCFVFDGHIRESEDW